jgi:hypothetical protein
VRKLLVVLAVVLLALAAAGCGGGDDESSASGDTTVTESVTDETTTEETTTAEETTDTGDLSGILADEDCLALAGIGATIAQAYAGGAGTAGEGTAELQALVDKVPDEIRADVQVIAEWYADYAAKLEDIGIQAGETPSADQLQQLQAALASFDQQELTQASERLSAWASENCSAAGG